MKRGNKALLILGPTASGKTRLAVQVAHRLDGEIVSADSRQVYVGLDIGTGKDLDEYASVSPPVRYHLIDIVPVTVEFNLFDYLKEFKKAFVDIEGRNKLPIIVGGTGLYLEALLEGYTLSEAPVDEDLRARLNRLSMEELRAHLLRLKPKQHNTTDLLDRDRLIRAIEIAVAEQRGYPQLIIEPLNAIIIGTRYPREVLKIRISERLKKRLREGLIDEVQHLLHRGVPESRLYQLGLEYRYVLQFLKGEIKNNNDLFQKLRSAIWEFARRQEMWFRRLERKGHHIYWLQSEEVEKAIYYVKEKLQQSKLSNDHTNN